MVRTVLESVRRNPETGEERIYHGNYNISKEIRAGFTEQLKAELMTYEMTDEDFFNNAKRVEK